jgi:hypothetical protein
LIFVLREKRALAYSAIIPKYLQQSKEPRVVRAGRRQKEAHTRWAKAPATDRPRAAMLFPNRPLALSMTAFSTASEKGRRSFARCAISPTREFENGSQ